MRPINAPHVLTCVVRSAVATVQQIPLGRRVRDRRRMLVAGGKAGRSDLPEPGLHLPPRADRAGGFPDHVTIDDQPLVAIARGFDERSLSTLFQALDHDRPAAVLDGGAVRRPGSGELATANFMAQATACARATNPGGAAR